MDIPELNKKLDKVVKQIQNNYNGTLMVLIGSEANTMIRKRVTETGINAEGQKFKPYSTKPTLVGCSTFVQESSCTELFASKEKRKELEWRTVKGHRLAILPGGYKKIRELDGRQTNHVDFIYTGRMWKNINVISKSLDHTRGTVIIGARSEDNKDKLAGNTAKRGDILDLSRGEQDDLKRSYKLQVLQIFKENGL